MAYSTVDDVSALIPTQNWNPGVASQPTSAEVTADIIPQVDAEIDARLATLYSTPITGAASLALLTGISARMAAIRIWGTAFTQFTGDANYPKDWDEGGRKLLEAIVAGRAELSDAAAIGEGSASDPGAVSMTMRPIEDDSLQDVEMRQAFPPGQVF